MPLLATLALATATAAPVAADDRATLVTLRGHDERLAAIAFRLATANRALCRELAPTPGWAIHALTQYGAAGAARAVFGFDLAVAVEVVVPGSPAAAAGVLAGDSVAAVNGEPVVAGPPPAEPSARDRDAAAALVARQPAGEALRVELVRGQTRRAVNIPASPGCRSAFEVIAGRKLSASSDGTVVQIGERFFAGFSDAEIAVVVAHELAHTILRHRARLEAAGVKWGLLANFGRNARLFRLTEDDADRLAVSLLFNAGYDPASAAAFWRAHSQVIGWSFGSATHAPGRARALASECEAASIPAGAARPWIPPLLATRDAPLQ